MLFPWIASLVAFAFLGVLSVIGMLPSGFSLYLMPFCVLLSMPIFIPVIREIRTDMVAPHRLLTKPGIVGLCVGILLIVIGLLAGWKGEYIGLLYALWVGVYFSFESRWYFLVALVLLVMLVIAMVFDQTSLAETMSIYVYYGLVLGVLVQVISPVFGRVHRAAKPVIELSPQFMREYAQELVLMLGFLVHVAFLSLFVLAFSEIQGWIQVTNHSVRTLIAMSVLFLFCIWTMFRKTPYTFQEFFSFPPNFWDRFVSWIDPVLQLLARILQQYLFILCVASLVIGIFGTHLPLWVQVGAFFIVLICLGILQRFLPVFFSYAKK